MLPIYELAKAVKDDDVDGVKQAIAIGADPNGVDLTKHSMLSLAEIHHANRVVPNLVRSGCNFFERIGQLEDSLLHRAAKHENIGFAATLLKEGASPNIRNANGETPLHIAAAKGLAYFARLLLDHQASALIHDNKGRTPLDLARREGNAELVAMLRRREDIEHYQSSASPSTYSSLESISAPLATVHEQRNSFAGRLANDKQESSINR